MFKYILQDLPDSLDFQYLSPDYIVREDCVEETESLRCQIKQHHRDRRCVVCIDALAEMVFFPCTHIKTCYTCSLALASCPWCREEKQTTFRITLMPLVEKIRTKYSTQQDIPVRLLITELEQLKSSVLCRTCGIEVRNTIYMSCGYILHCEQCAEKDKIAKIIKCRLCSRVVLATSLVFHYQSLVSL